MIELFRYIEQSFVLPTPTDSINVENQTDFQARGRAAASQKGPPDQIIKIPAQNPEEQFPSPVANPIDLAAKYKSFRTAVVALKKPDDAAIEGLVEKTFGETAQDVVSSDAFVHDKEVLDNSLVAVKLVTGFDKVNAG